ncbi:MAG: hypothetical protein FWF65_06275, partial [Bacteroidetes bacterium]|nr:hypothetical protein [Bacteroidota bacterium]
MEQLTNFTNLYSLSKTLRFELIPQGKTLETFSKWIEEFNEKETSAENLFAKDKNIFDAYVALKPILDKIHEEFITYSLESEIAKGIKFEKYYELYKKRQNKEKDDDSLSKIEKALRESIGETYKAGKELFDKNNEDVQESIIEEPESYDEDDNESDNEENKKKKSVIKFLMDKSIINHIDKFVKKYVSEDLTEEKLKAHLATFKGFYTYFSGYNINRRNYYEFKEEKATAIATRIVHENLPTFCDNVIRFEDNKDDYLKIYEFLKDKNIITEIKNATTDTMTEIECIKDDIFKISHFSDCLSQLQIEEYNRYIRSYNYLINLYNQSHRNDKDYKKIDEFEILYKQIGCGTKKELLFALIKSKENELTEKQKQQRNAILTVEKTLNIAIETGKKYFEKDDSSQGIRTIPDFMDWLRNCEDWNGIYWSKVAVTKISNTYFANWHDLKDKLKGNKACVSFDKNREEQIKLNDAVELSGLFTVLDQNDVRTVFKNSVFENFKDVINYDLSPSKNLINFLCADIEKNIIQFLNDADNILNLEKYKEDKNEE